MKVADSASRTRLKKRLLALAGLALLPLMAGGSAAAFEDDARMARELTRTGAILPLERIIQKARQVHLGRIIEAELKYEAHHGGYVYEVKILDTQGAIWEVEFNAATGELVEQELEGDD